jgi:mannose-1-phosphate guanylyltransferase
MSQSSPHDFYAVIPAGGSGTRLWPLSRSQEPKFLLDLLGTGKSLLVETIERLSPFADENHVYVVTGEAHVPAVMNQAPGLPTTNVLSEPSPKNSAAAVGLAAYVLNALNPDAIVGFFAADHVIQEDSAFQEVLRTAISAAESGHLVTIGITPHEPSSAFGYIKKDGAFSGEGVHHVGEFVEKPSFLDAQRFLASGDYLWNAGIFVGKCPRWWRRLMSLPRSSELRCATSLMHYPRARIFRVRGMHCRP